jgi:hypothetical protein
MSNENIISFNAGISITSIITDVFLVYLGTQSLTHMLQSSSVACSNHWTGDSEYWIAKDVQISALDQINTFYRLYRMQTQTEHIIAKD